MSLKPVPTERDEQAVLLMARAGGLDGYEITDLTNGRLIRLTAAGLARRGLLRVAGDRIFLTRQGFDFSTREAA